MKTFKEKHYRLWYWWHWYGKVLLVTLITLGAVALLSYYCIDYLTRITTTVKVLGAIGYLCMAYTLVNMWVAVYQHKHSLKEHLKYNANLKANSYIEKTDMLRGDKPKSKK